jgi:hypothetical protein
MCERRGTIRVVAGVGGLGAIEVIGAAIRGGDMLMSRLGSVWRNICLSGEFQRIRGEMDCMRECLAFA